MAAAAGTMLAVLGATALVLVAGAPWGSPAAAGEGRGALRLEGPLPTGLLGSGVGGEEATVASLGNVGSSGLRWFGVGCPS